MGFGIAVDSDIRSMLHKAAAGLTPHLLNPLMQHSSALSILTFRLSHKNPCILGPLMQHSSALSILTFRLSHKKPCILGPTWKTQRGKGPTRTEVRKQQY